MFGHVVDVVVAPRDLDTIHTWRCGCDLKIPRSGYSLQTRMQLKETPTSRGKPGEAGRRSHLIPGAISPFLFFFSPFTLYRLPYLLAFRRVNTPHVERLCITPVR